MGKITDRTFSLIGKKGNSYKFGIYDLNTNFNEIGGIYLFTNRYLYLDESYRHTLIYCGKTNDLSSRFVNHHKELCIKKNNANCICVMVVSTERERTEIETDLLNGNNFKCNEIFN